MWRLKDTARLPTETEMQVIEQLQHDLTTHFNEEAHERLLQRLWLALTPYDNDLTSTQLRGSISAVEAYERHSFGWIRLGFQCEDPAIDFRGGGQLALQSIVYFAEMYRTNSLLTLSENKYSWAIAGINLSVLLMQILGIIPKPSPKAHDVNGKALLLGKKRYWAILEHKSGFYEFFVYSFMMMHSLWSEKKDATEMQFNEILRTTGQRIKTMLNQRTTLHKNQFALEIIVLAATNKTSRDWVRGESLFATQILPQLRERWTPREIDLYIKIGRNSVSKVSIINDRISWCSSFDNEYRKSSENPTLGPEDTSNEGTDDSNSRRLKSRFGPLVLESLGKAQEMKEKLNSLLQTSKDKLGSLRSKSTRRNLVTERSLNNMSILEQDSNQLDE